MTTTNEAAIEPMPQAEADAFRRELSGIGRGVLVERLIDARREAKASASRLREALVVAAGLRGERGSRERECQELTANVTALQVKANGVLASHRLARVLEHEPELMVAMLDLAWAIDKARVKHPEGASYFALADECGEVGRAFASETEERVCEELLDVAVVAIRLRLGERDARLAPVEPHAARSA